MIISAVISFLPPLAEILPRSIGPYIALMGVGFAVAIYGHLARARWVVVIGIMMIFLATVVFPFVRVAGDNNPPPLDNSTLNQGP